MSTSERKRVAYNNPSVTADRGFDRSVLTHFFLIFCASFAVGLLVIHFSAIYAQLVNTRYKQQDIEISEEILQFFQYDSRHPGPPPGSQMINDSSITNTRMVRNNTERDIHRS